MKDALDIDSIYEAIRDAATFRFGWVVLVLLLVGFFGLEPLGVPVSAVAGAGALLLLAVAARGHVISTRKVIREAPWQIVVFSDPDCPYCARLEQTLIGLDNVTIYTFLYPLEQLHPTAKSTAINIWCSKDPAKAMKDYMLAKIKPEIKTCKNPIDSNIAFGSGFGVQGTPSIIFEDGTLIPGAMSLEAIEQQLQKSHDKVVNNAK